MSKFILVNEQILLGGVDYTSYLQKGEIDFKGEDKDATTFGSGGWHERLVGLREGTVAMDFLQDFAAGSMDSVLWGFWLAGTPVSCEIRPVAAARSSTNPGFVGNLLPIEYKPLAGNVGEIAKVSISWPTTGAWSRLTA